MFDLEKLRQTLMELCTVSVFRLAKKPSAGRICLTFSKGSVKLTFSGRKNDLWPTPDLQLTMECWFK